MRKAVIFLLALLSLNTGQFALAEAPKSGECREDKWLNLPTLISRSFREFHTTEVWSLRYPKGRKKQLADGTGPSPFGPLDPDQVRSKPGDAGEALMQRVKKEICSPLPDDLQYHWVIEPDEHKFPGHEDHIYLRCQQRIDGATVEGEVCRFIIDPDGVVIRAELRFRYPKSTENLEIEWLRDREAIELALKFHQQQLGRKLGEVNGQPTVSRAIERGRPVMRIELPSLGVIEIDNSTRQASYSRQLAHPTPILPLMEGQRAATVIKGLGSKLAPARLRRLDDHSYIVSGRALSTQEARYDGRTLARVSRTGEVNWVRSFAHTRLLQLAIMGESLLVLQRGSGDPGRAMVHTSRLRLADGEVTDGPHQWQSMMGSLQLSAADGAVYQSWNQRNRADRSRTNWLSRSTVSGEEVWRVELPGRPLNLSSNRESDSPLTPTPKGDVLIQVSRTGPGEGRAELSLLRYSSQGHLDAEYSVGPLGRSQIRVLGVQDNRVYIESQEYQADGRAAVFLQRHDAKTLELLSRAELPYIQTRNILSESGTLLFYSERYNRQAIVGEVDPSGSVLWRHAYESRSPWQRVGFLDSTESHTDELTILAIGARGNTSSLVHFDRSAEKAKLADCQPIDHAALRSAERELWSRYHVFVAATPSQPVDTVCPTLADLAYHNFVEELLQALTNSPIPAVSPFIRVTVDPNLEQVEFGPMSPSVHFSMRRETVPLLFRVSTASAPQLAELLSEDLTPHLHRVHKLQRDLYVHTGLRSELTYSADTLVASTQQAESDLTAVLGVASAMPYDRYPILESYISTIPVVLGQGTLQVLQRFSKPSPRVLTASELDQKAWQSILQSYERMGDAAQADMCNRQRINVTHDPFRTLRLGVNCDDPDLIRQALDAGADPNKGSDSSRGRPPLTLHWASPGRARKWVELGARADAVDLHGRNALFNNIQERRIDNIQYLASEARRVNQVAYNGETVLHRAVFEPKLPPAIVERILKKTQDINATNRDGQTALHWSVHTPDYVALLIENGADVTAADRNGSTPLHRAAAAWGGDDTIAVLLEAGADSDAKDQQGRTALDIARSKHFYHNQQALLRGGNR